MTDENRSEEQTEAKSDAGAGNTESAKSPTTDELFEEVNRLGTRFAHAMQTAWNSEERKKLEADLKKGLGSVSASLEEGFQKISDNEKTRGLVDQADDVMTNVGDKVRSSEVTSDVSASLAKGLRKLSDQLEKWVDDIEHKPASQADAPGGDVKPGPDDDYEIPIDKA